eukprot:TRINITY_DN5484_c0_g1_i2.p1 TRINITY_DN5484_c0_g1~~TRINITY_DN5484_c0_g1_i2.p1  ORF type:complete len:702 (+),score=189.15 TRINITY_DN5484_c0_g1_i2:88-2193(+)
MPTIVPHRSAMLTGGGARLRAQAAEDSHVKRRSAANLRNSYAVDSTRDTGATHPHTPTPQGASVPRDISAGDSGEFGLPRELSARGSHSSADSAFAVAGDKTLTDLGISVFREAFAAIDEDSSGTLDVHELRDLWLSVFPDDDPEQATAMVEQIFLEVDEDGSEEITFDELVQYLCGNRLLRKRPETIREWTWALVEPSFADKFEHKGIMHASMVWSLVVQLLIFVSIINMMVETMPEFQTQKSVDLSRLNATGRMRMLNHPEWGGQGSTATFAVETFCIGLFSLEFLLRVISTPSQAQLWTAPFTWIDLLAILPYYLVVSGAIDDSSGAQGLVVLRVIRMVRLVRVLRVLKLGRHSQGIQLMVVALSRSHLALTWLCMLTGMAMTLFASLIFYTERDQAKFDFTGKRCIPEVLDPVRSCKGKWVRNWDSKYDDRGRPLNQAFQSIPDAMWWVLVTLTTVGYGDSFPRTELGKATAGICMMSGTLVLAYPVTILTSSFSEAWDEWKKAKWVRDRQARLNDMLQELGRRAAKHKAHRRAADRVSLACRTIAPDEAALPAIQQPVDAGRQQQPQPARRSLQLRQPAVSFCGGSGEELSAESPLVGESPVMVVDSLRPRQSMGDSGTLPGYRATSGVFREDVKLQRLDDVMSAQQMQAAQLDNLQAQMSELMEMQRDTADTIQRLCEHLSRSGAPLPSSCPAEE